MNRRPIGVTLSAVVLGLAAAVLLLFALLTALGGVVGRSVQGAAASAPPVAIFTVSLFYMLLAVGAVATVVGLVRMRPWARVTMIVLGALLALAGLFSTLMCFAMPRLMASVPLPPNTNPAVLRAVFTVMALVCVLIAAIGVWWLIYFALRSIRAGFALRAPSPAADPHAPPPLPHAHALEFYEAEPLPVYAPPHRAPDPLPYTEAYQPAEPVATAQPKRPVSMTVLAVLLALACLSTLPAVFLGHTQMVVPGAFLNGGAARIGLALMFLWLAFTATGLVTMHKAAWYMACVYCLYTVAATIAMMLPSGRTHMAAYVAERQASVALGTPQLAFNPFAEPLFHLIMLPALGLAIALNITFLVLLYHARRSYGVGDTTALRKF